MTNIDVILQIYGHFISFWHLDKLLQMLKMRCDRHWLREPAWTAVTVDHNTPRHCFLWDKDKGLVYRGETLWFWLGSPLDLGVLLLLRAFATDVELRTDALPQDDLGRCLCDLLVWQTLHPGSFHLLNSFWAIFQDSHLQTPGIKWENPILKVSFECLNCCSSGKSTIYVTIKALMKPKSVTVSVKQSRRPLCFLSWTDDSK